MTGQIDVRIYEDRHLPPGELFERLAHVVSAWSPMQHWEDFSARESDVTNIVASRTGEMEVADVVAAARHFDGPARLLSAGLPFRCWAFDDDGPRERLQVLRMGVWGPRYGNTRFQDRQFDGYASLTIRPSAPFYAALGEDVTSPDVEYVNLCVGENLEGLLRLIRMIATEIRPLGAKLFTDEGLRLPFNAHCAFYRDLLGPVRDVRHLAHGWTEGFTWYPDDPPLHRFSAAHHEIYLHLGRSGRERDVIWGRLDRLLPNAPLVTPSSVASSLSVSRPSAFVSEEVAAGTMVYGGRFFLNMFVDEFFTSLLDAASVCGEREG